MSAGQRCSNACAVLRPSERTQATFRVPRQIGIGGASGAEHSSGQGVEQGKCIWPRRSYRCTRHPTQNAHNNVVCANARPGMIAAAAMNRWRWVRAMPTHRGCRTWQEWVAWPIVPSTPARTMNVVAVCYVIMALVLPKALRVAPTVARRRCVLTWQRVH